MQNSYPYTYEDSDELWLKQEEILENPLENEAELERAFTANRLNIQPQTTSKDFIFSLS